MRLGLQNKLRDTILRCGFVHPNTTMPAVGIVPDKVAVEQIAHGLGMLRLSSRSPETLLLDGSVEPFHFPVVAPGY